MFESGRILVVSSESFLIRSVAAAFLAFIYTLSVFGQGLGQVEYKSQEVSDVDGIPVLIKNLPDWESKKGSARLVNDQTGLRSLVGERPVIAAIEFSPGSEAAIADYDAGKLIIVEHPSPQASIETDRKINESIAAAADGRTFNKRIGNYNVLVLDASGRWAANALIDQVKYEKQITWLGNNPFAISAERAFVLTTSDIFMSTLMVIVGGVVFSILGGLVLGFVFFSRGERRRARMTTFSDAGGMTRLNLDGFTPEIIPDRLLGD